MISHAIPYERQEGRRDARAYCGAWVLVEEHTEAPTCPRCVQGLAEEATINASLAAMFDDPDYGKATPVPPRREADPVAEYEQAMARYGRRGRR